MFFICKYDFWHFFIITFFQENVFSNNLKMSICRKSTQFPSSKTFWKRIRTFSVQPIFGHMKFQEIWSKHVELFHHVRHNSTNFDLHRNLSLLFFFMKIGFFPRYSSWKKNLKSTFLFSLWKTSENRLIYGKIAVTKET